MELFDTHTHLGSDAFESDVDQVLERARVAGVTHFVMIGAGDGLTGNERALSLASRTQQIATLGIHPHDAGAATDDTWIQLRSLFQSAPAQTVRAWGEIGLDYHYMHAPKEVQVRVFQEQLAIAFDLNLPIVIHTREAEEDTLAILEQEKKRIHAAVVHCFTGTPQFAAGIERLGHWIGLGGVLTFKNAEPLRAIAARFPMDRILLETDCPYLAPVPYRGKRNEPSFLPAVVSTLATCQNNSAEECASRTTQNAFRFFGITSR